MPDKNNRKPWHLPFDSEKVLMLPAKFLYLKIEEDYAQFIKRTSSVHI